MVVPSQHYEWRNKDAFENARYGETMFEARTLGREDQAMAAEAAMSLVAAPERKFQVRLFPFFPSEPVQLWSCG